MIKASALYIVIIMALVIALLCSSLISAAYFYRAQYQHQFRYDRLANNVNSGISILLASRDSVYNNAQTLSLFGGDADSVTLQRFPWGIYDIGVATAFIQKDTLYKSFSMANLVDSAKWAALYLADQDRPLDLSGKTAITGNAFLPKAGVQKAYVNQKAYQGDERLINGKRKDSEKSLPPLNSGRVALLNAFLENDNGIKTEFVLPRQDTIANAFTHTLLAFNVKKNEEGMKGKTIRGHIMLVSDTALVIDSSVSLDNVIIFAPSVIVRSGFHGRCQIFAGDSIHVEARCSFDYPSCLGVLNTGAVNPDAPPKIMIDTGARFNGVIFNYQQQKDPLPVIILHQNVVISGQVYSQGILRYTDHLDIRGSVFTRLFVYQNHYNLMENMLIDCRLNTAALSAFYLTSDLLPAAKNRKKILQWLEAN